MHSDDVEQVIALELALLSPRTRGDRARVDELLDPEFTEIGASGRRWTRADLVQALQLEQTNGQDAKPIEAVEITGMVIGPGLILLTYLSDPLRRPARRSSLWRRSGPTGWRLLHHQGTLIDSGQATCHIPGTKSL